MQKISTRHVAAAILVLGIPALGAVLVWTVGLFAVGAIGGVAGLALLFAPGLAIYWRMWSKVFREPMRAPAAPWNACIALNAAFPPQDSTRLYKAPGSRGLAVLT
jgi:hypothetical protein